MPPAPRQKSITLTGAAQAAEVSPDHLLDLIAHIRAEIAAGSRLPHPPPIDGGSCDWEDYRNWAVRMGLWTYRGRRFVGYAGVARLVGLEEQTLRKMRAAAGRREPQLEDMPTPVRAGAALATLPPYVLFDLAEILTWGRQVKGVPTDRTTTTI